MNSLASVVGEFGKLSPSAMRITRPLPWTPLHLEELQYFDLEGSRYMALPISPQPQIPINHHNTTSLVTILPVNPAQLSESSHADDYLGQYLKKDDVMRPEFLAGILLYCPGEHSLDLSHIVGRLRQIWGTSFCAQLPGSQLSFGPHLLRNGKLYNVYRLYDDINGAFMMATKPTGDYGSFQNLRISGEYYQSLSVAVPPRTLPDHTLVRPLEGLRFAIKDMFQIKGLKMSACNRAYYDLCPIATVTAPTIQRLIDQGAHLLGTLKLGSLVSREEPTESADYHAPFNPRGDGYQSAWSSSSGSGAAVAAYDWLDFTVGTDTTGSSRRPAMANGCFQIRVSHGRLSLNGTVPMFSRFDSPAIFGRDVTMFEGLVGAWLDSQPSHYDTSISIIYLSDYLPVKNKMQMKLLDSFLEDLESTHNVTARSVSIAQRWETNGPPQAQGVSLEDYVKDVGVRTFCYDLYHALDEFRTEFHEKYGKEPYVNPVTRWRWDIAQTVTQSQRDDAMYRLEVYKQWFLNEILQVGNGNTLIMMPITTQEPDYRDTAPDDPTAPSALDSLWLAPILGAPEISLPIGEIKYYSRVSQRDEYLPVTVSLLGPPGSDMALIDAACHTLEKSNRPTRVKTGSRLFE